MIRDSYMSSVSRPRDFRKDEGFGTLRGLIDHEAGRDQFPSALILVSEVREQLAARDDPWSVTEDEAYAAIHEAAARLGIEPPFRSGNDLLAYHHSLSVRDFQWEMVLIKAVQDRDVAFLADDLRKVMFRRLGTEPARVLITDAEKFAPSLGKTVREHPDTHFVLTTSDLLYFRLLNKSFQQAENVETILADMADRDFVSGRFDLILASPDPDDLEFQDNCSGWIGRRRWERRTEAGWVPVKDSGEDRLRINSSDSGTAVQAYTGRGIFSSVSAGSGSCPGSVSDPGGDRSETELVALANLLPLLCGGGRLVITLSAVFTTGAGEAARLRNSVRQDFTVRELAEIPTDVINGNRGAICLLDIENSRSEGHITQVRRYSRAGFRAGAFSQNEGGEADFAAVRLADLDPQDPWLIGEFLAVNDPVFKKYMDAGIPKAKLSSAARVFPGRTFRNTRKVRNPNIVLVGARDAVDREVTVTDSNQVKGDLRKLAEELLQEGDVLIAGSVTRLQIGVFCPQSFPCIAAPEVFVVRPDPGKLLGNYLMIFLTSPTWEELVKTDEFRGTLSALSLEGLQDLSIPLPPLEEQQAVVAEYFAEKKIYLETQQRAEERWQSVLRRLQAY